MIGSQIACIEQSVYGKLENNFGDEEGPLLGTGGD